MKNILSLNKKGFTHVELLIALIFIAIFSFVGYRVMLYSRADGGYVCYMGPQFTGTDGQPWYQTVLQNRSTAQTNSLSDIAFSGTNGTSTFTWNAGTYPQYVKWSSGFSGVKILPGATVVGQVRKPSNPANVGQSNWTLIITGTAYKCGITSNINRTYTDLTTAPASVPVPAPVTAPATAPAPTPATTAPASASTPASATANSSSTAVAFICSVSPSSKASDGLEWYTVTVTNKSGTSTASLGDINMRGQAPASSFIWNGLTQASYFHWVSGFSGTKILSSSTVVFQVRKPTTPSGVGQADWTLVIGGKSYACAAAGSAVAAPATTTASSSTTSTTTGTKTSTSTSSTAPKTPTGTSTATSSTSHNPAAISNKLAVIDGVQVNLNAKPKTGVSKIINESACFLKPGKVLFQNQCIPGTVVKQIIAQAVATASPTMLCPKSFNLLPVAAVGNVDTTLQLNGMTCQLKGGFWQKVGVSGYYRTRPVLKDTPISPIVVSSTKSSNSAITKVSASQPAIAFKMTRAECTNNKGVWSISPLHLSGSCSYPAGQPVCYPYNKIGYNYVLEQDPISTRYRAGNDDITSKVSIIYKSFRYICVDNGNDGSNAPTGVGYQMPLLL